MNYNGLNSYTSERSSQTSISSLCNFFTGIACLCLWEFQFRAWRRKTYVHCLQLWRLLELLQVSIHIEFLIDLSRIIKIQLDFNLILIACTFTCMFCLYIAVSCRVRRSCIMRLFLRVSIHLMQHWLVNLHVSFI